MAVHVSGNHLVNASGQTIRLLGVDLSASEFACDQGSTAPYGWSIFGGPNDQPSTAQAIANWNANAVRVPLNEDCWLGINRVNPAYGGTNYQNAIHNEVSVLHSKGLYVILDLHWNAPGTYPAQSQQPLPDADHAPAFWSSVAASFRSDPAVVFDLYNEPFIYGSYLQNPNQDVWACWLNGCGLNQFLTGGNPYTLSYNWQTAGMQQLVNNVRAAGAGQPIMVGGLDWANDLSGWLSHEPQDPNHQLAASWHSYPGQPCAVQSCWTNVIQPLAANVPVVVGETGDNVCSAITYVNAFLPWADAHGLSYVGWTFNPWGDCANILVKDWSGTPSNNYGVYFYNHLRSLPRQNPFAQ